MDTKQVLQLRVNKMNIGALKQAVEAQGKRIGELEQAVQTQAQSLITMSSDLQAMRISLAQATAALGSGPTSRSK